MLFIFQVLEWKKITIEIFFPNFSFSCSISTIRYAKTYNSEHGNPRKIEKINYEWEKMTTFRLALNDLLRNSVNWTKSPPNFCFKKKTICVFKVIQLGRNRLIRKLEGPFELKTQIECILLQTLMHSIRLIYIHVQNVEANKSKSYIICVCVYATSLFYFLLWMRMEIISGLDECWVKYTCNIIYVTNNAYCLLVNVSLVSLLNLSRGTIIRNSIKYKWCKSIGKNKKWHKIIYYSYMIRIS